MFRFIFLEYSPYYLRAFSSEYKLTKLILWDGCSSYNRTSQKKSTLINKPSAQIPKVFNQHGTAGRTRKYVGINTLIQQKSLILFQGAVTSGSQKYVSCMGIDVTQGHDNKISRACPIFMIDETQLKFKNQQFLRLQINTLCQENYGVDTHIHWHFQFIKWT